MEPILKYVDLLAKTFGPNPDQKHWYPGHPEIELALLRLFERIGNIQHREFATYFIGERGNLKGQEDNIITMLRPRAGATARMRDQRHGQSTTLIGEYEWMQRREVILIPVQVYASL